MMPFIEENDQTRARTEHLDKIRELVGNVYPNKFIRSRVTGGEDTLTAILSSKEITKHVPRLEPGARPTPEQLEGANSVLNAVSVRVSGRISVPPRVMGKAAFVHLSDGVSRLQIYVRRDDAKARASDGREVDGWELFVLLDHGDFIGVEGYLFVTKTGELSVHVREIEFLAKALVPMPDKMHGITDAEIGRRQRYVDLIAGSLKIERDPDELTTREVFERRSKLITEMRHFLDAHGYIEVETPMLTPIASGAAARPFKTHHHALDIDLYARIAPELYLKRLLVGGFERVYELNRNFRNEGIGYRWNPEFTMLEFYCAYMDVTGMMDFCEEMLRTTEKSLIESLSPQALAQYKPIFITYEKLPRLSMKEAIFSYWPEEYRELDGDRFSIDWLDRPVQVRQLCIFLSRMSKAETRSNRAQLISGVPASQLRDHVDEMTKDFRLTQKDRIWRKARKVNSILNRRYGEPDETVAAQNIAELFEGRAEKHLTQPTFITDFPKPISPLSKASPADSSIAERFELFVAGMEIANGFSELNDPYEQEARFLDQQAQRERGDEEAMRMDEDYLRALAYGMPPAAGIGIGIDRLTMLITNRRSIRDVILFPHMRPAAQKAEAAEQEGQE